MKIWHFYTRSSLTIYVIDEITRGISELKLGNNQTLIKRGSWFGASLNNSSSYALVGCTVSPAFSFADFELTDRKRLTTAYPEHQSIIEMLTRY
jgi:uncharacterized protein